MVLKLLSPQTLKLLSPQTMVYQALKQKSQHPSSPQAPQPKCPQTHNPSSSKAPKPYIGCTNLKFLTPSLSIYVDYSHAAAISVPHCCHCTAATHVMAALALLAITMVLRGCWRSPHYIDIPTVAVQMPSLMSRPQMSSRWHSKHPSRTPCT